LVSGGLGERQVRKGKNARAPDNRASDDGIIGRTRQANPRGFRPQAD